MTKEQMKYCFGCDHLNRNGEPTCDYLSKTGKTRGCPVGEGCPYHTKLQNVAVEDAQLADVRRMFDAGATVKEIAGHMGWAISKAQRYCRTHGMTRKPGWNKKGEGKPKASAKKPKQKKPKAQEQAQPDPDQVEQISITLGQFISAIKALLPEQLNGAALYIDGTQVRALYGYSVTMPEGKLTVDLFTRR